MNKKQKEAYEMSDKEFEEEMNAFKKELERDKQ